VTIIWRCVLIRHTQFGPNLPKFGSMQDQRLILARLMLKKQTCLERFLTKWEEESWLRQLGVLQADRIKFAV